MELAHTRTGTGEPVLLLHGITHRRQGWDRVVPLLAQERELWAVDLPSHGDSPDLPGDYGGDIAPLADAVEAFCAAQGLDRPHAVGNSMGGLVALELAARGTVRSATALSPAGFWSRAERVYARAILGGAHAALAVIPSQRLERMLATPILRTALLGLLLAHPSRIDPVEVGADLQGLSHPRSSFATMLAHFDTWIAPARSAVPTTVGWGSRDMLLPRWQSGRLRRALPDAAVYVLPGCGHVPMGDDPALVADFILAATRPRASRAA
ncbi:alpha/beta fold hydrolase [Actinomycetospora sp. CA-053990]|uniref:alpha/beta fold hydrolase n=1 Tax=Actinomycetospora sp. CA-053990 TaxID=3239891 RepID=UPI003D94E456